MPYPTHHQGEYRTTKYWLYIINFGFDYVLSENNYFNIDFKKYSLSTDVFVDAGAAGTATAKVDIDPLAVSIGYGWRF